MPRPPPPAAPELYNEFIKLISATSPQTLELDILPSSHPLEIHTASSAVALPKLLLASLFLTARQVFLSYLSSPRNVCDQDEDNHNDRISSETEAKRSDLPSYTAALESTLVILLWDPNYLTAANFRKKHLLSLRIYPSTSLEENGILLEALAAELHYLTSLLTSPLSKHTKSSTLWSHRLFLVRTFGAEIVHVQSLTGTSTNTTRPTPHQFHSSTATLWSSELAVILKAGERHPRNYYSWDYARQLLDTLASSEDASFDNGKRALANPEMEMRKCLAENSIAEVQKWCFAHPRDISGWAFLAFLLREMRCHGARPTTANRTALAMDVDLRKGTKRVETAMAKEDASQRVVGETKEFVRKFGWKGASVEWFLNAMGEPKG
ncbi:hypothetical protein MMC07_007267 [Pseudocyphellaria aurata]|nr:hypothetical protein [Pseudocyphellaria aurata]